MMTSRAAVFHGPGLGFTIETLPVPTIFQPGEMLVRVREAAICGSDIWSTEGSRATPIPGVLGHEGWGVVLRSTRREHPIGQAVTWSLIDSCGLCRPCRHWSLPQKCLKLMKYGHSKLGLNGTFSELICIQPGTPVIAIEPRPWSAMLNCALATAVAVADRVPRSVERVLVLGAGMVGLATASLLAHRGYRVVIEDPNPVREFLCRRMGLQTVPEGQFDGLVEICGQRVALQTRLGHLRVGGSLVLAGLVHPDSELPFTAEDVIRNCWSIVGVHNYNSHQLAHAVELDEPWQRIWDAADQMPVFGLDAIDQAFASARERSSLRVVVRP